ncbi:hypothetical protein GWI33_014840 [Rhynchophorus ferrugineus]|uniref:Uncharacterized protein n=1 Tax=Rhynchophorus ferrugineus TaxID=354439 RepID=A0A834MAA7_RHYFE|nr:hypothetical protein GWI33_014840 [Rhynchophorus ferrugineus]
MEGKGEGAGVIFFNGEGAANKKLINNTPTEFLSRSSPVLVNIPQLRHSSIKSGNMKKRTAVRDKSAKQGNLRSSGFSACGQLAALRIFSQRDSSWGVKFSDA